MKLVRIGAFLCVVCVAGIATACGSKRHEAGHETAREKPDLPPPTPDYTPITALRTPAGLVLISEEKVPPTQTPPPAGGTPVPRMTEGGAPAMTSRSPRQAFHERSRPPRERSRPAP